MVQRLKALQDSHPLGLQLMTTMLSRLASITGHTSIESLWTYVDWAFDEGVAKSPAFSMTVDRTQSVSILTRLFGEILLALPERPDVDGLRSRVAEMRARLNDKQASSQSIGSETVVSHPLPQARDLMVGASTHLLGAIGAVLPFPATGVRRPRQLYLLG